MYSGVVARIKVRKHPNADRLQVGTVCNVNVIVGLDTKDGDLGIYFPPDGQLSEEFCEANNLIGRIDTVTGKRVGGYFGKSRRVKAQTFRGVKSFGFWIPINSLKEVTGTKTFWDEIDWCEGDDITVFDGTPICNKYITSATTKAIQKRGGKPNITNKRFAKHFDTKQLLRVIDSIPKGSILYITEKVHGTSARTGNVLTEGTHKRTLLETLCCGIMGKGFKRSIPTLTYKILTGTRNVILGECKGPGFYGSDEFRGIQAGKFSEFLHKGEIVYYEIVGYTTSGKSIMNSVHIPKDMKDLRKLYGGVMQYAYGCKEKECETYVYRITNVNEDGIAIDLPWQQVVNRCRELGVKHVPNLKPNINLSSSVENMLPSVAGTDFEELYSEAPYPFTYYGDSDTLLKIVKFQIHGTSTIDQSHIREGVVLRAENEEGVVCYKLKSHEFLILDGFSKDRDCVDMEEAS